jgi:hypothetical protein
MKFETRITEISRESFIDNEGNQCIKITRKIETPRQTYIKGDISGKYRGDLLSMSNEFYSAEFYDFEIYEAFVNNAKTQKNKVFSDCTENEFPKEKLPQKLQVCLLQNGKNFRVNILEPKLCKFYSNTKFHQTEGNEIFGTFTGEISGYILDYESKYTEEIHIIQESKKNDKKPIELPCQSNGVTTGKTEKKGDYVRREYYCQSHDDKIWGAWEFKKDSEPTPPVTQGCLSTVFGLLGLILGLIFLFSILPILGYLLPFILFIVALYFLAPYLKWVFRIIGLFLLFAFISSIISLFNQRSYTPKPPVVVDSPREQKVVEEVSSDEDETLVASDTIIKRYRSWEDYDGTVYEGEYSLLMSKVKNSTYHKNSLRVAVNSRGYDEMLFKLKENDKKHLSGLFSLFDSIGKANRMNRVDFAKMVVCFVQDMPYTLILNNGCDPALYSDRFVRSYLSEVDSRCVGNQKFGIHTPLEFLYTIDGDCDSRTLLLYTILSHYDFDVAILSSEHYGHSILGVNLPIQGTALKHQNQKYVVWETTSLGTKPGFMPNQFSNLNYWRISLKSK